MIIDILIGVGYKGGVENVVNRTADYFVKQGHRIRIVQIVWLDYSWVLEKLEFYTLTKAVEHNLVDIDYFASCYREFLDSNGLPDIVLATGWPIIIPMAKKALERSNSNVAVLSWLHGNISAYSEIGLGGYNELLHADAHLAINQKLAVQLRQKTSGEIIEVTNPIDISKITFSESRSTHKLAYVGRIAVEKNIPFLLNALSLSSPVWTLDVIRDSDEEGTGVNALRDYCRELGIEDRVTFHGWLNNPWPVLTDTYALVLPSTREGSPLVIVEAMLCGMPVISTPTDGAIERIIPGKNGYLFPFNDTVTFLKLLELIENGSMPKLSPIAIRESMDYMNGDAPLEDMLCKLVEYVDNRKVHKCISSEQND